jgi:hypothetical protein
MRGDGGRPFEDHCPARATAWAEQVEPRHSCDQRSSDRWRPQHVAAGADPTTARRHLACADHPGPPDGPHAVPVGAATGAWASAAVPGSLLPAADPGNRLLLVALAPQWRQNYPNNRLGIQAEDLKLAEARLRGGPSQRASSQKKIVKIFARDRVGGKRRNPLE